MLVLDLIDCLVDLAKEWGWDLQVVAIENEQDNDWEDEGLWQIAGAEYQDGDKKLIVIV